MEEDQLIILVPEGNTSVLKCVFPTVLTLAYSRRPTTPDQRRIKRLSEKKTVLEARDCCTSHPTQAPSLKPAWF